MEKTQNGLGFSISGGLFTEHLRNDHGIFVTKIIAGGSADLDGKLAVGDRLISVNDFSLEYVTHDDAVAAIASIVEQYNEIVLRVGKLTHVYSPILSNQQQIEINKLVFFYSSEQERERGYICLNDQFRIHSYFKCNFLCFKKSVCFLERERDTFFNLLSLNFKYMH